MRHTFSKETVPWLLVRFSGMEPSHSSRAAAGSIPSHPLRLVYRLYSCKKKCGKAK